MSQWVVLASFAFSIGFAAWRMGPDTREAGPYECSPAAPREQRLERQTSAAHGAGANGQVAPPRGVVVPAPETADPQEMPADVEAEKLAEASAPQVDEEPKVEPPAPAPQADDTRAAEESVSPVLEPELKAESASVEEGSEPALEPKRADKPARFQDLLDEGRRNLREGQIHEAELAFRRVLTFRQGRPAALAGLARVYLTRGEIDQARSFAERAVQLAPYQAPYRILLGDVLRLAADSQGAESEYRFASRLSPTKLIDRADRALPANPF